MVFRRFSASALTRDISRGGYLSAMFRALWRLARRHEEWDLAFRSRHAQLTPAERGCSLRRLWKGREVALPVDPGQRAPWSSVCPTRRGNDGLDGSRHARRAFAPCCRRLSYTMNAHPHRHRCHDVDAQFGTPSAGPCPAHSGGLLLTAIRVVGLPGTVLSGAQSFPRSDEHRHFRGFKVLWTLRRGPLALHRIGVPWATW